MKNLVRALMGLLMLLAAIVLSSCTGAPGCPQNGFGSGTPCTPGTPGGFGGGGGGGGVGGGGSNATPAAFVYAVDQNGGSTSSTSGTIDGFDLSTSAVTFKALGGYTAPTIPGVDPGVAMIVVNKKYVYAFFELTEQVFGWSIDPSSGNLKTLAGFPLTLQLNLPIVTFNQYNVTTDPGGNFMFISDSGANSILVYAIDSSTGALTAVPGSPFATPFEPGNVTTDGLGRFLYVCLDADHVGTEFFGYTIGANGALTLMPSSPFAANVWQLQGDASGRYLIGTSGNTKSLTTIDDNHLYVFAIQQSGATAGAVAPAAGSPVSTQFSPFTIAMQPATSNGEFVYSFSINDTNTGFNSIEGYQLNTNTGALAAITGSPFGGGAIQPGKWGQFDQSGANLLVYSTVNGSGGTLTQLIPLSVASDGTLTAPIAPVTLTTPGYWVVTDP